MEVAEIATALGIPVATVLALLLRGGVESEEFEGLWEERTESVNAPTRAAVVGEYNKWVPIQVICAKFGLQKRMVWQILLEEGVPIRRRHVMAELVKLRRDAEIVDMYVAGVGIWEIATSVGVSVSCVNDVVKRYNVPPRQAKRGKIRKTPTTKGELVHPRDVLRDKFGVS